MRATPATPRPAIQQLRGDPANCAGTPGESAGPEPRSDPAGPGARHEDCGVSVRPGLGLLLCAAVVVVILVRSLPASSLPADPPLLLTWILYTVFEVSEEKLGSNGWI